MIAQVFTTKIDAGPLSDDTRKYVIETMTQARQADGCEAIINLDDPATGEGLVITLFRDQAALDAFDTLRQKLTAEAEETLSVEIAAPRVYSEVLQA